MKKVILFATAVAAISFTSCIKERDCTCKETTTDASGSSSSVDQKYTYKDVTKRQAKNNCISMTYTDAAATVHTRDCKLE